MSDYKGRTIELTPQRQGTETWCCAYRILEFSSTCWKFHTGKSYGHFGSREEAVTAALEEAKRIIDALEPVVHRPRSDAWSVLQHYEDRLRRFFAWSQR